MRIYLLACLLVLGLATAAGAQTETRYWWGAQQGVGTTVSVGAPWTLRWQRFEGIYTADSPGYYVAAERLTVGTGAVAIGWDRISWGAPLGVTFESVALELRGAGYTVTWLPTGWDLSVGWRLGDLTVGYTEQRRFGGGCAQYPYCDNSGPYLAWQLGGGAP
jgi:hypothetical protein